MRSLEGKWVEATQETKGDGGETRQGMVQEDDNVTKQSLGLLLYSYD